MPADLSNGQPKSLPIMLSELFSMLATFPDFSELKVLQWGPKGRVLCFLPWASKISSNFWRASPEFNISKARSCPFPLEHFPSISRIIPESIIDFFSKSWGEFLLWRTLKTSRISRLGPMPFPIGWLPSVRTIFKLSEKCFPILWNLDLSFFAWEYETFAPLPHGISRRIVLLPAASFFASIDAISCDSGSTLSILSTRISLSSAGARPREPPHARQAFVFLITLFISFNERFTFVRVSTTSAVPAALVIALEEVLGMIILQEAQIDTTIGVVLFPGIPPMLCSSAVKPEFQVSFSPVSNIAFVREMVSSRDIFCSYTDDTK